MYRRRLLRVALALAAAGLFAGPLYAQMGEQPIRIIFPFAAGAGGRIGINAVKASAPDGSMLLLTPIAPLAIYQHFYPDLDYDPIKDFAPITELGTFDFGIAVAPQLGVKTLKELVAWAKANPAQ